MARLQKVLVVCVFAVLIMEAAEAQITCNQVVPPVAPCLSFLQSNGMGAPSVPCCNGVKKLKGMATSSPAKRQICACLKPQLTAKVTDAAVTNLPNKCGATLGFKISKNMNCNAL